MYMIPPVFIDRKGIPHSQSPLKQQEFLSTQTHKRCILWVLNNSPCSTMLHLPPWPEHSLEGVSMKLKQSWTSLWSPVNHLFEPCSVTVLEIFIYTFNKVRLPEYQQTPSKWALVMQLPCVFFFGRGEFFFSFLRIFSSLSVKTFSIKVSTWFSQTIYLSIINDKELSCFRGC